ncbi:hypothetical protein [Streptomyces litchfieldiae]|uniref:Uncharacterized protein n=1 Tax=Streptomyces litchfieldiae TaxID=3075543 RepID=A0ABU2MJF4_9ACTN|nr:hypothetical protein [Streptomyces sp. DSM 44938]MDT0341735.1 hypothetical protein [Streptomyces sp. DSM 44938]
MSKSSHGHPNVGALVRDAATNRVGVYMGKAGPFAMLRPVSGGREWQARPEDLRPEVSDHPRPADVEQLRAAHRYHLEECGTCTPDEPCDIERVLSLACEEATRPAESA